MKLLVRLPFHFVLFTIHYCSSSSDSTPQHVCDNQAQCSYVLGNWSSCTLTCTGVRYRNVTVCCPPNAATPRMCGAFCRDTFAALRDASLTEHCHCLNGGRRQLYHEGCICPPGYTGRCCQVKKDNSGGDDDIDDWYEDVPDPWDKGKNEEGTKIGEKNGSTMRVHKKNAKYFNIALGITITLLIICFIATICALHYQRKKKKRQCKKSSSINQLHNSPTVYTIDVSSDKSDSDLLHLAQNQKLKREPLFYSVTTSDDMEKLITLST